MRWTALAATLVLLQVPSWGQRMLTATPSVLQTDSSGYGEVGLSWSAPATRIQVRVGSADGEVLTEGGAKGRAITGNWVTAGTKFFLQDVSLGEPGMTMATLTAGAPPAADPDVVHYIAASSTSWNTTVREPAGAILFFDRDTGDQTARLHFPAPAYPVAASADGGTLYAALLSGSPGIAVIDVRAAATRSLIPVLNFTGKVAMLDRLLLAATFDQAVAVVDLETNSPTRWIFCPAKSEWLLRNPGDGVTYGLSSIDRAVCVITPELQTTTPIVLPQVPIGALLVNDLLLVTSGQGAYRTVAIRSGSREPIAVPSLDGVNPVLFRAGTLYGVSSGVARRYTLTIGPDRAPVFTPQAGEMAGVIPAAGDDRFVYSGVVGSCSTIEGPVVCGVGFQMLDPLTLSPSASIVLAKETSFGLYAPRAVSFGLGASYRVTPRSPHVLAAPARRPVRK